MLQEKAVQVLRRRMMGMVRRVNHRVAVLSRQPDMEGPETVVAVEVGVLLMQERVVQQLAEERPRIQSMVQVRYPSFQDLVEEEGIGKRLLLVGMVAE